MDDIVRGFANCVDRWLHRHARGERNDSHFARSCRHFFSAALRDGQTHRIDSFGTSAYALLKTGGLRD